MPDAAAPHPPSRSPGLAGSIREAAGDIKLAHSVFALPFALLAAVMAFEPQPKAGRVVGVIALVVVCMVLARTWAMLFNRIVDRDIDAQNPRTDRRAVASGRLPVRSARAIAGASALGFIAACAMFWVFFDNAWPIALSVPTLVWIAFYSLTKRFTWWCHVFLGGALAASPLAAALAVRPGAIAEFPATHSSTIPASSQSAGNSAIAPGRTASAAARGDAASAPPKNTWHHQVTRWV
ncbi:MAG: UbiA family prenyltransferase, partial [Phycisphaerales bacterium JB037]